MRSVRVLAAVAVLAGCQSLPPNVDRTTPPATTLQPATTLPVSTSIAATTLPTTTVFIDGDYTPPAGALNPAVTQDTIGSTICVTGWTATVRPPVSFTTPLKLAQMAARHLPGVAADFELDHFIALEIGGAPRDPANLWPERRSGPHASAAAKDLAENRLHKEVCAGTITLAEAQLEIRDPVNWHG